MLASLSCSAHTTPCGRPLAPQPLCRRTPIRRYQQRSRVCVRSSNGPSEVQQQQQQQSEGAQQQEQRGFPASMGNSGIAVEGFSPTSIKGWSKIKEVLRASNVKVLSAQELSWAQEKGMPIIDIRPRHEYIRGHIPGAKNIPFYQPISGWTPMKIARRAGYALFGVFNGTEVNPQFTQQVSSSISQDSEDGSAIIYCSLGGSLDPVESSKKGLQSRSLIAAWQLVTQGCPNISVLRGGYSEWVKSDRAIAEGSE